MAKLVVLTAAFAGRSHELNVDMTTVGRVEDNTFQLADPSVSSHHCEVLLRGSDVVVKDLDSTNGSFINGEKISESVLKPGQTLRLGQIELRLETEGTSSAPAPVPATSPAARPAPAKKGTDHTTIIKRGVSLNELEQGPIAGGFDTSSKVFAKKTNKTNMWFLIIGIVVFVVVGLVIAYIFTQVKAH